eukprot:4138005-Pyramimonas_sp.AAC.1
MEGQSQAIDMTRTVWQDTNGPPAKKTRATPSEDADGPPANKFHLHVALDVSSGSDGNVHKAHPPPRGTLAGGHTTFQSAIEGLDKVDLFAVPDFGCRQQQRSQGSSDNPQPSL